MSTTPCNEYELSDEDAKTLSGLAVVPYDIRVEVLRRYFTERGLSALVSLFANTIGMANRCAENADEVLQMVLIEHGVISGVRESEGANVPTLFGACQGVLLANSAQSASMCHGCAFRLGSCANTSPITTSDVMWQRDNADAFMCHEEMDENGKPTKHCAGFAVALSRMRRAWAEDERRKGITV